MNIMVIEDDDSKWKVIKNYLNVKSVSDIEIIRAKNMAEFSANLSTNIGLFIIDFRLPGYESGIPLQNGIAILEAITKSGKADSLLLAISSYPNDFPELRAKFEAHGCILTEYSNKKSWQATLDHLLVQLKKNIQFDFLIFCALQAERAPYTALLSGRQVNRGGIDCFDIEISKRRGSVILLPNMGLVNASVVAGQCIDRFKPKVIGMSGICGGFANNANLGQLFVSSMAYEYQSGKWASDGFKQEPYQVQTDHSTLTKLKFLLGDTGLIKQLEEGFDGVRPSIAHTPKTGIFTSGSAVIADKKYLSQIETIHRKVNALDMEVFAIHRAAELSPHTPSCICAKTVVDLCDSTKNDGIHLYGAYISAKFLVKAIDNFFVAA
jgi:nucleoside phosphorylase